MLQSQPNALDLTTLQNVKLWLRIASTDDDGTLQRLLTGVSSAVQVYINRTIAAQTYTEILDGNGLRAVMVANYPIISVASVTVDGVAIPPRAGLGQSGYTFDRYAIALDGFYFTRGRQNVTLAYTGGYAATPFDLEQAVIELVGMRYRERDRIGLASKGLQGETTAYSLKAMPDDVKVLLDQYRRVTPPTGA